MTREKNRKGRVKRRGKKGTLSGGAMIRKQRSQTGRVNSRRRDGKAYGVFDVTAAWWRPGSPRWNKKFIGRSEQLPSLNKI